MWEVGRDLERLGDDERDSKWVGEVGVTLLRLGEVGQGWRRLEEAL